MRLDQERRLRALDFLLGPLHSGALAPEHRADLAKSGLRGETIQAQFIRSVPPSMIDRLVGFPTPKVSSSYILPYPNPAGGWLDHVRLKVFPSFTDRQGRTCRYLGPKGWPPRVYFPLSTLAAVLKSEGPLWLAEGAKKALALAQLGLPAVGFEGIEAWHAKATQDLLPDFDLIPLSGRDVALVPDGDVQTNLDVARGVERFADALEARGGRVRVVMLPAGVAA